jgi:hypothetical protein
MCFSTIDIFRLDGDVHDNLPVRRILLLSSQQSAGGKACNTNAYWLPI